MLRTHNTTLLSCALLYACSGGVSGADGATSLVNVTAEPAGDNCADGGLRIDTGIDDSNDGVLDEAEIDSTTYVCNGSSGGAGATALVDVTDEPAGDNCSDGGQRVDVGVDDDGNGVLDAGEIDETTYVCNGENGLLSLVTVTEEPAGDNCADGGQRIDVGIDDSGDGVLDAGEIDDTQYVCDGSGGMPTTPARYLYLANWAASNRRFDIYDIEADSWSSGPDLPVSTRAQLDSDGTMVWMYGQDNYFYTYDIRTDAWTQRMAGPSISSLALFRIFDGNLYVCDANSTTLHVYGGGAWSTVTLSAPCSIAGGTDAGAKEIYVKTYYEAGFSVIDAATNTVARTITDTTYISENTSSAAFLDGFFYTRDETGNIFQLDGVSGAFTDTGLDPGGDYPGFCSDPNTHIIYSHYSTSFQAYDPAAGTLTPLTTGPDQSTLGTCTLTY